MYDGWFEMSVCHNLGSSGKRVSMREYIQQVGLWECVWGIVLIVLIEVGAALWVNGIIQFGVPDCIKLETAY